MITRWLRGRGAGLLGALWICLGILCAGPAKAQGPILTVHLTDGSSSPYPLLEIRRLFFAADTLVVALPEGEDRFPAAAIRHVDFLWDTSGLPEAAEPPVSLKIGHLFPNQPNPFSPLTRIEYELERPGRFRLTVFDVSGRQVRTLAEGQETSGRHGVEWDGRDESGRRLPVGLYFYRLWTPEGESSRRMILLR